MRIYFFFILTWSLKEKLDHGHPYLPLTHIIIVIIKKVVYILFLFF